MEFTMEQVMQFLIIVDPNGEWEDYFAEEQENRLSENKPIYTPLQVLHQFSNYLGDLREDAGLERGNVYTIE